MSSSSPSAFIRKNVQQFQSDLHHGIQHYRASTTAQSMFQETGDSHIPMSAKIILGIGLIISIFWLIIYYINLDLGKEGGDESKDENNGKCTTVCGMSFKDLFLKGFTGPLILGAVCLFVAWLLIWKKRKSYAMKEIFGGLKYKFTEYKKYIRFFGFGYLGFILYSIAAYALVNVIPLGVFKEKEYSEFTTRTACHKAKKKWCKNIAPNLKIVLILTIIGLVSLAIASIFVFKKVLTPEEEMVKQSCQIVSENIKNMIEQNPESASLPLNKLWNIQTSNTEAVSYKDANTTYRNACKSVLQQLQNFKTRNMNKQLYGASRQSDAAKGAGFFSPKGNEQSFEYANVQQQLKRSQQEYKQRIAQEQQLANISGIKEQILNVPYLPPKQRSGTTGTTATIPAPSHPPKQQAVTTVAAPAAAPATAATTPATTPATAPVLSSAPGRVG